MTLARLKERTRMSKAKEWPVLLSPSDASVCTYSSFPAFEEAVLTLLSSDPLTRSFRPFPSDFETWASESRISSLHPREDVEVAARRVYDEVKGRQVRAQRRYAAFAPDLPQTSLHPRPVSHSLSSLPPPQLEGRRNGGGELANEWVGRR